MIIKARTESDELIALRFLDKRMELPPDVKLHYFILKKGYEGEVKFDGLTADLDKKFYILKDIRIEINNTQFQIDTLIITRDLVIICEIKNYQGDYYYENGDFFNKVNEKKITNPLHQIDRCQTLLRQFLQQHGIHLPIVSHLVFINDEFFLYKAPLDKPIIYRPQLPKFLKNIDMKPSDLNSKHRKIADLLLEAHTTVSPFEKMPTYSYEKLRKGLTCASCHSFSIVSRDGERKVFCEKCGHEELVQSAIVRGVEELRFLFPDMKVTTGIVFDWCSQIKTRRKIGLILKKHYKSSCYGKWTHYV